MSVRDLFLLDPDVVFLNHGSFGACPRLVFQAYQDWQLEVERQPVKFFARRYYDVLRSARTELGAFLHTDPDNLVYVANATYAINTIARSLELEDGDEVLTTDHEYSASDHTWHFVWNKRGVRYVQQPVKLPLETPEQFTEAVWSGVTDKTKVLFLSHITSPTAIIFPIAELIKRARERGIISVIDGAHAPGQFNLNLDELDPDFYFGNCHKWMMTPKGSGFLYARPDKQELVQPLLLTSALLRDLPAANRFLGWQEYQGTDEISAFLATPDAIRFMTIHDWPAVRQSCHEVLAYARREIAALTGLEQIIPDDPAWYLQLASFPLPPFNVEALKRRLYDEFKVEVPVFTWNNHHFVRVSVQGYNTKSDIDTLLEALAYLLPQVAL